MSRCDYDAQTRYALPVPTPFSSDGAGTAGEDAPCGSGVRAVVDTAPGHGGHRNQVFLRRQDLLTEITAQRGGRSLSDDEQDYLSRMSSTISTMNVASVASIDVLKLCIVCSRFYPRIDLRRHLALLKSEIEASLRVEAI